MRAASSVRFLDQFDRVVLVSLASRPDRRRLIREELARIGWADNPKFSVFDAFTRPNPGMFRSAGSHGCYHSHLAILWQAAVAGESVLILQDDCLFLDDAFSYQVPEGTDVFYGGFMASDPADLHRSEIIGAHCMGFSARAASLASRYLTKMLHPDFQPCSTVVTPDRYDGRTRPPIDGALVWFRRAHPELRTEFHLLCEQASSRSDISPNRFDRLGRIGVPVDAIRSVIGERRHIRGIGERFAAHHPFRRSLTRARRAVVAGTFGAVLGAAAIADSAASTSW